MDILKFIYIESGIFGLLASVVLGLSSVGIAIYIYKGQNKQMASLEELTREQKQQIQSLETLSRNIDEHVLGTLRGFDHVLESMLKLLETANKDESSTVYFMAYWLWFGADKEFEKGLTTITRDNSAFFLKLRGRIAENKQTKIVVYDNQDAITNFVEKLVKYKNISISKDVLETLVASYMKEIAWVTIEASLNKNVMAKFRSEIPAIIFAVEGETSAGIWYIGETAMLEQNSQLGGFMSQNPAMVAMLTDQVKHFAK